MVNKANVIIEFGIALINCHILQLDESGPWQVKGHAAAAASLETFNPYMVVQNALVR